MELNQNPRNSYFEWVEDEIKHVFSKLVVRISWFPVRKYCRAPRSTLRDWVESTAREGGAA
jgi:hypothetical protein